MASSHRSPSIVRYLRLQVDVYLVKVLIWNGREVHVANPLRDLYRRRQVLLCEGLLIRRPSSEHTISPYSTSIGITSDHSLHSIHLAFQRRQFPRRVS